MWLTQPVLDQKRSRASQQLLGPSPGVTTCAIGAAAALETAAFKIRQI